MDDLNVRCERALEVLKNSDNRCLIAYNIVLHMMAENGNIAKVTSLLSEMEDSGYIPDANTYDVLYQGFLSGGLEEYALQFRERNEKLMKKD